MERIEGCPLCENKNWFKCVDCGKLTHWEDAHTQYGVKLCGNCWCERGHAEIADWHRILYAPIQVDENIREHG